MLIHVSVQDLQRNLDDYSKEGVGCLRYVCSRMEKLTLTRTKQ